MGAAESNPVRNLDKRTARRTYRSDFVAAIKRYRNSPGVQEQHAHLLEEIEGSEEWQEGSIKVCVRKRPIFKDEIKGSEFDVLTCIHGKMLTVHDARMHADMRRQLMHHHEFTFDSVFNSRADNDMVYQGTASPLVQVACDGGFATCLMYGQTGSGKTYTMSSIYERAANDIFTKVNGSQTVTVSFVEISGDKCCDLLNGFQQAQLLTGQDGSVHAFPVVEPAVQSPEALVAMINHGCAIRTTEATGVHDASSRSHAVLRIYVQQGEVAEGCLTLVDLAGSEHRIDSMYHTAKLRKEGAQINASLMALKQIVHAKAKGKNCSHIYRKSKLTMALKMSFLLPTAKTVVIATVSPSSKDTEHSLNTLRHACLMDGQQSTSAGNDERSSHLTGGNVRTVRVGAVSVSKEARKMKAASGRERAKLVSNLVSNGNTFGQSHTEWAKPPTEKEVQRIHRAAERRAIKKLSEEHRRLLQQFREVLGRDPRQQKRLQQFSMLPKVVHDDELAILSSGRRAEPSVHIYHKNLAGGVSVEGCEQVAPKSASQQWSENYYKNTRHNHEMHNEDQPVRSQYYQDEQPQQRHEEGRNGGKSKSRKRAPPSVFRKLKSIIYNDVSVPESVKEKQFRRLLRSKGYSDEGVGSNSNGDRKPVGRVPVRKQQEDHGVRPADDECGDQSAGGLPYGGDINAAMSAQDRPAIRAIMNARSDYRQSEDTPYAEGATRSQAETEKENSQAHRQGQASAPPRKSRRESVQERRKRIIEREQAQREAQLNRKREQRGNSNRGGIYGEIEDLEGQIANTNSAATKVGLKKRLAQKKAVLVRQERKANQAAREAQRAAEDQRKRQAKVDAQKEFEQSLGQDSGTHHPGSPLGRAVRDFEHNGGMYDPLRQGQGQAQGYQQNHPAQQQQQFDHQRAGYNQNFEYSHGQQQHGQPQYAQHGQQQYNQQSGNSHLPSSYGHAPAPQQMHQNYQNSRNYAKNTLDSQQGGQMSSSGTPRKEIDAQNWSPATPRIREREKIGGVQSAPFANDYTWDKERW